MNHLQIFLRGIFLILTSSYWSLIPSPNSSHTVPWGQVAQSNSFHRSHNISKYKIIAQSPQQKYPPRVKEAVSCTLKFTTNLTFFCSNSQLLYFSELHNDLGWFSARSCAEIASTVLVSTFFWVDTLIPKLTTTLFCLQGEEGAGSK